jgi:hypothetical protein
MSSARITGTSVKSQLLRRLEAQVSIHNRAVAFGADRDAEAELSDGCGHLVHRVIVLARVARVFDAAVNRPSFKNVFHRFHISLSLCVAFDCVNPVKNCGKKVYYSSRHWLVGLNAARTSCAGQKFVHLICCHAFLISLSLCVA